MAEANPDEPVTPEESREPTLEDLVQVCKSLNQAGARYMVVGGFAIRAAGYTRQTMDIDLLVETSLENEQKVIQGLLVLPDQAAKELRPGEIADFAVVRVADEITVDLMKSAGAVNYAEAIQDAVYHEIDGVKIPFASPLTLWRMKQTVRAKDIADRLFLRKLLEAQGIDLAPEPVRQSDQATGLRAWLKKVFSEKK